MKKTTTMILKTFISGAAGALILPAGMYVLSSSGWTGRLADPGEWVSGTGGAWPMALAAIATGVIMVAACNPPGFVSSARHSVAAGFLAGVFLWLGSNALLAQNAGGDNVVQIIYAVSVAITASIPFFAVFCVAFAFIAVLGGLASKTVLVIAGKLISHKTST